MFVQYEGKQFLMTVDHMNAWDEVERQICKEWKEMLLAAKDKNKYAAYLVRRIAGEEGKRGFLVKTTDGRHRCVLS